MLDFLAILLIGILLVMFGRRLRSDLQPIWLAVALSILLCFLADWILLAELSHQQLSFGPVPQSLLLVSGIRLVVFTPALYLLQRQPLKRHAIVLMATVVILQAILLASEVDGFYIEPFRLTVTELPVQGPAFLPDRPLRILQISDLHVERITRRERDVLTQAATLQPDIIVLTGDYINSSFTNDPQTLQETRQILSQLRAPYGIYAVNGNTDSPSTMSALFDGLENIRVLADEILPLAFPGGTLYLIGITNRESGAYLILDSLMESLPRQAYTLLLYHYPDMIETAPATGLDLFLAGHTHGAQVRLPFYGAVIPLPKFEQKFDMGRYKVGPTTLYVSRGIGMRGGDALRMRFFCPPELVLVELGK